MARLWFPIFADMSNGVTDGCTNCGKGKALWERQQVGESRGHPPYSSCGDGVSISTNRLSTHRNHRAPGGMGLVSRPGRSKL